MHTEGVASAFHVFETALILENITKDTFFFHCCHVFRSHPACDSPNIAADEFRTDESARESIRAALLQLSFPRYYPKSNMCAALHSYVRLCGKHTRTRHPQLVPLAVAGKAQGNFKDDTFLSARRQAIIQNKREGARVL